MIVDESSGEILDVNPYAEQLFGYSRQELVGQRLWEIEAARDTPGLRAALEQTRDQHTTRFAEMSFKTKGASGELTIGPECWAEEPPGPRQRLEYYRLAPPVDDR